jgi:hypothetical protein
MVHIAMGLRDRPATGHGAAKTLVPTLAPEMIEMIVFIGVDLPVRLKALLTTS